MAVDMFLKMPPVKGESRDNTYKDAIDVLAWSWGASNSGTTHLGDHGGGKVSVQDLSVTKYVDGASPDLILACCDITRFDEALLTVRKGGGQPVEYIKITMNEVLVNSISTGGSGGEDRLTEIISLNFAKVKVEYTGQDEKGAAGKTMTVGWDIAKNVKFG